MGQTEHCHTVVDASLDFTNESNDSPAERGRSVGLEIRLPAANNMSIAWLPVMARVPGGLLMPDNQLLRRPLDGDDGQPLDLLVGSQDDRVRKIFGLPEDSPIPGVGSSTLAAYYDHLVSQVSFPFDALCCEVGDDKRQLVHQIQVTELMDPRQSQNRGLHGLLCKARNHDHDFEIAVTELGLREDSPNSQLVDDYTYWFVNWR